MKKKIVFLAALCLTMGAYANILRVNNVDSSAPYASIAAAVAAAADGDTIMVDGTSVDYDDVTINKRLVVIGPGYWLRKNEIATEAAQDATIGAITTTQEGTVLMGLQPRNITINASKTIVKRCCITEGISISKDAANCVIHQNFIGGDVGAGYDNTFYHQITNNIFGNVGCKGVNESYIAYNTSYNHWGESFWNSANCKIEKNIFYTNDINVGDGNTIQDNYIVGNAYQDIQTDKDVRDCPLPQEANGYGAFAGNDPYVISGIPAGPMIEELTIPTSVEEGSVMEVTIKFGTAK
jgi:hypothetical protein